MSRPSTGVRVVCRLRPPEGRAPSDVQVQGDGATVQVGEEAFRFDRALGPGATQADVTEAVAGDLSETLERGYGMAVLAYGQTGSGKTHSLAGGSQEEAEGLIPRSVRALLSRAASWEDGCVTFSAVEIYENRLRDLLNPDRSGELLIRDYGQAPRVDNLEEYLVSSWAEAARALEAAYAARAVAATAMNAESSRSHALHTFRTRRRVARGLRCPVLVFADLAGSEDIKLSQATGQSAAEACSTNLALAALGSVVAALTERPARSHVPYRDSKLTHLLLAALKGKSVLRVLVTLRSGHSRESRKTLKFGECALSIESAPVVADRLENSADMRAELASRAAEAEAMAAMIEGARVETERLREEIARASQAPPPQCAACVARARDSETDDFTETRDTALAAALRRARETEAELEEARGAVANLMDMVAESAEVIANQQRLLVATKR